MNEKERIRKAPFLVHVKACRHYNVPQTRLFIHVDIAGQKDKLILSSKGIFWGELGKRQLNYDERGREFFNELMPKFMKIQVKILNGEQKDFDNYEEFLDEIV